MALTVLVLTVSVLPTLILTLDPIAKRPAKLRPDFNLLV